MSALFSEHDHAAMQHALALAALAATLGEVPVGAVVYHALTGQIIGAGFNRRALDGDPTAHAEMLAITAAAKRVGDWRLTGYRLAVTLEPCCMCAGAIVLARLDDLVFAAADPKAGACGSLHRLTQDARLNHRLVPRSGLMAEQSAEMLRTFFRSRRT